MQTTNSMVLSEWKPLKFQKLYSVKENSINIIMNNISKISYAKELNYATCMSEC